MKLLKLLLLLIIPFSITSCSRERLDYPTYNEEVIFSFKQNDSLIYYECFFNDYFELSFNANINEIGASDFTLNRGEVRGIYLDRNLANRVDKINLELSYQSYYLDAFDSFSNYSKVLEVRVRRLKNRKNRLITGFKEKYRVGEEFSGATYIEVDSLGVRIEKPVELKHLEGFNTATPGKRLVTIKIDDFIEEIMIYVE